MCHRRPDRHEPRPRFGYLPVRGLLSNDDPVLYVTDSGKEERYDCVDVILYSPCLNNRTVESSSSKEGALVFQLPDSLAQSGEQLYIAVTMGGQVVYCPLM